MIGTIIRALVGRELGRRTGGGGTRGAVTGAVAFGAMRRMGPLGMLLGGGYVAKKAYDRHRASRMPRD